MHMTVPSHTQSFAVSDTTALQDTTLAAHQLLTVALVASVSSSSCAVAVQASRIVDRGPAADAGAEADAFRRLWDAKAEMRRFPDGAINEAVAWDNVAPELRGSIPELIVTHILELHIPGAQVGRCLLLLDALLLCASLTHQLSTGM
jgi:Nrap protein domain 3